MSWSTFSDYEIIGVVKVVTAGVDSFNGILSPLWVGRCSVFCTSRHCWVGWALTLLQTGAPVHVLVA